MAEIADSQENPAFYSPEQELYILNFAANAIALRVGTQDALEQALADALKELKWIGWNVVWGPKVWKNDPNGTTTPATNAWYVAAKGSRAVLAIAGTAPESFGGWSQDFDVINTTQWDGWVADWPKEGKIPPFPTDQANDTKATIARGTAQGTYNILSNKSTRAGNGTYVQDFLRKLPAGTEIYTVGHSMGGALAPAVALGLVEAHMITDKKVRVLGSAGASPGNVAFAERWTSKFEEGNFYNTLDIVPQAWQVKPNKDRCFPNIYNVIFKDQIQAVRDRITQITKETGEKFSISAGITYVPVRGKPFTSDLPIKKITDVNNLDKELIPIIHEQHVTAYTRKLGIRIPVNRVEAALDESDDIGYLLPELAGVEASID